jgi:hypothetical protein
MTLSVLGILAAIVVAALDIDKRIRERRGLRLTLERQTGSTIWLRITNMNAGQTKWLAAFGGSSGRTDFRILAKSVKLPIPLQPEESVVLGFDRECLLRPGLTAVRVWDSTGKAGRLCRKELRRITKTALIVRGQVTVARAADTEI